LQEAGLPLQATTGSGYHLGNQQQLSSIGFSRKQALALFTARTLAGTKAAMPPCAISTTHATK